MAAWGTRLRPRAQRQCRLDRQSIETGLQRSTKEDVSGVISFALNPALGFSQRRIFVREIRIWKGISRMAEITVSAIVVALFFSGANLENFTWPFQISFILVSFAGTCAILSLIRYAETMRDPGPRAAGIGWLGASIGAATRS